MNIHLDRMIGGRPAFSLVELVLVMGIVATLALFAGPVWVRASRQERNLRAEAYVRTRLVMDLERIARELSLAERIDWMAPDGTVVEDSRLLSPDTNYVVRLFYPEETGGVSFETNRISQVSSLRVGLGADVLYSFASNHVDHAPAEQRRLMFTTPVFPERAASSVVFSSLCVTNVLSSSGEVRQNLVHVTLSSTLQLDEGEGGQTEKVISVDRLAKLWNVR